MTDTPTATPLREANQQRVDAAAQRVRQAMDYRKYLPGDPFRKDVELLIEIALAPVLEIFEAAQPAATPMAGKLTEWLKHSRETGSLHVAIPCDVVEAVIAVVQPAPAQPQRESEQPEQALRRQVELAIIRYQILLNRMKGCVGVHEVSNIEVPGWISEAKAVLSPQTDSQEPR